MRLETLLNYNDIVIQCHDDPDADTIASGFALQKYLESQGKQPKLVYSGPRRISKGNLTKMVKLFHIDIAHTDPSERREDPPELLITVDCQDGESNVTPLPRRELAAIDHHCAECSGPKGKDTLREVRSDYGACSTILWSMLKDAGFELDRVLSSALYYGLYMDTVAFKSLASAHSRDQEMRRELESGELDREGIEELKRANLNAETLRILGKAISELHFYHDYHFAVAQAQPCDPNILGVISDQVMEVDGVDLCVSYCLLPEAERKQDAEFKFSVRSYLAGIPASDLAQYIANGLGGNAGGRNTSAGGVLSERALKQEISDVAEIGWDGFSSAVGRLIYRKIADYCENSSALRKAYPELAQKLEDDAYVQRLYTQAERGIAAAQNDLGFRCLEGSYVGQNDEQAVKWFRMAAEQGLAEAQHNLALCYYNGRGAEQDWRKAAEWFHRAAAQGVAEAQLNLGLRYANGEGVDKDPVQAAEWYRRAAEQGNASAQLLLGLCYYSGSGVEQQDFTQSAEWIRKAAEQGLADAQLSFGKCFYYGWGVKQDLERAVALFRKAAEVDNAEAKYILGLLYRNGDGVEQDLKQAAELFREAAKQDSPEAQYMLGACYYNGTGVEQDLEQAETWLRKAAEQGNPDAQQALAQYF
ncbi:hypothetical protein D1646_21995 [Pseudoflavonifractor sp. 60]|uniref:DHH family phosphoesterase n=1 Tax=Pseudoflavonifractor sp. 60 TaxID=2304576 RepID=UPI00137004D8|nr:DHH family phosphoesterase [Pseudoflavonifractor sp. 60]NBI69383.1 hypothetical protein [Pseudoflavonifractor sp. 60]